MEFKKSRSERTRIAETVRAEAPTPLVENQLLLAAPIEEFDRLRPHLEPVDLPNRHILNEASQKIDYVYFLNAGMTSLVILTSDGRSVEVSIVGREGLVGAPLVVGA